MFFSISWNDGVGCLGRIAPFLFLRGSVFLVHVALGQFSHKKKTKTIKNPWFWSIVGTSPCRIHGLPSLKPGSLGAYKGFSDMNGNNDRGHKYSTWSRGPTAEVLPNRHVMNGICKQQWCIVLLIGRNVWHVWHVLITSQLSHQPNHHLNSTPITQSGGYPRGLSNNTVSQGPLVYHVPHGMPISRYTPPPRTEVGMTSTDTTPNDVFWGFFGNVLFSSLIPCFGIHTVQ